ncbi:MAG: DEAD/DEAH box helicase [Opitutales bacterium]|jgi:ATP-dependent RNA helicase RhlE
METDTATLEVALTPAFADLGLPEFVLKAVADAGYTIPTPIQTQAIPQLLEGRDLIGGSQTGTGKTAAFALPLIARLHKHGKTRALILEPTRELAQQVYDAFVQYAKHTNLRLALLYGGVRYGKQRDQIDRVPDIIVATPGRLLDYLGQKVLALNNVETLILDEADRMLDMGFMPDVRRIIGYTPAKRQSLLFSATVPPAIETLSKWMLHDPVTIRIGGGTSAADTITHSIYPVDDRQKFDLLVALLDHINYDSALIFTRTKHGADTIARWLEHRDHKTSVLHSDRTQKERERAMGDFRSGASRLLVATDIVARGIDISGISHVINYDIPQHPEDYVHRIGRTGRACHDGEAVTLYTAGEQDFLRGIERFIGQKIDRSTLDGFDYTWSPVLDEKQQERPKKRNRSTITSRSRRRGR